MRKSTRTFCCVIGLFIGVVLVGSALSQPAQAEPVKDGVFFHISTGSDNPARVVIPLRVAEIMAEDKEVLIYFDIEGIEVVFKDTDLEFSQTSSLTILKKLIDKGVQVYACRVSLNAVGKTEEDLIEGVTLANKATFQETFPGNELPGYFHPAPPGQRQANVLESSREDKNLPL